MSKKAAEKEKETSSAFDCLAVTQVQVFPFQQVPTMGHVRALATVVLNDQFQVRGLRVMEGDNGLFVGYPVDPFYKGEDFRSVCFPITKQLREHIENCILEKYSAAVDPKEWVVEFKNGDELSIKMEVSEFTRADAIELAKHKIASKYGNMVAKSLELVSADEK